jgi:hypothetical protein
MQKDLYLNHKFIKYHLDNYNSINLQFEVKCFFLCKM